MGKKSVISAWQNFDFNPFHRPQGDLVMFIVGQPPRQVLSGSMEYLEDPGAFHATVTPFVHERQQPGFCAGLRSAAGAEQDCHRREQLMKEVDGKIRMKSPNLRSEQSARFAGSLSNHVRSMKLLAAPFAEGLTKIEQQLAKLPTAPLHAGRT